MTLPSASQPPSTGTKSCSCQPSGTYTYTHLAFCCNHDQLIIISAMHYANSMGQPTERSIFRRRYDLQTRRQKRLRVGTADKLNAYCCLVVEYPLGLNKYRDYELMCVDQRLNLRMLQEFLLRKMRKSDQKHSLLFEVAGRIKSPGESLGMLRQKFSEDDGFLYLFVRTESTF